MGVVRFSACPSIVVTAPTMTIRLERCCSVGPGAAGRVVAAAAQAAVNDPESRLAQSWRSVSAPNRSLFT
jgi:hypothetical protein